MAELYSLNSILDAIENINSSSKKKIIKNNSNEIKKIENNQSLLPITEKLILEAENYSKLIKNKPLTPTITNNDILILDNEYVEQNVEMLSLEEVKKNVIDDLYSSLSKKVKKNTLKIIFELHQKIIDLEKQIEFLNSKNIDSNSTNFENNIYQEKNEESIINKKSIINKEHIINEEYINENEEFSSYIENEDLSESVIKTLKSQDLLIKNLKKNEEKFLLKIVDLEQDISLLNDAKNKHKNTLEDSVKESKQNNIDQITPKVESELFFFKENYEKLIIENNDIKKRLSYTKKQIETFESTIKELENASFKFNKVLSKNSIIKLDETYLKTFSGQDTTEKLTEPKLSIIDNPDSNNKKK